MEYGRAELGGWEALFRETPQTKNFQEFQIHKYLKSVAARGHSSLSGDMLKS